MSSQATLHRSCSPTPPRKRRTRSEDSDMDLSEEERRGRSRSASPRRHHRGNHLRSNSPSRRWRSTTRSNRSSRSSSLASWPSHRVSRSPSSSPPTKRNDRSLRRSSRFLSPSPRSTRPALPFKHAVFTQPVRIYLGHLAVGTSEKDIKRLFEREDISVLDVSLFTRYEPCFAFCTVASAAEADHALRYLNRSILNNSLIKVDRVSHVEGTSTLPRVVIEGLPPELETLDVLHLAEEHAKDPHRVTCESREMGGGKKSCVGSFMVGKRWEAEQAVESLKAALGMFEQVKVRWDFGEAEDGPVEEPKKTPARTLNRHSQDRRPYNRRYPSYDPRPPYQPLPPPHSYTYSSSPSSSRHTSASKSYYIDSSPSSSSHRPPIPRRPSPLPSCRRQYTSPPSPSLPRGREFPYPRSSPPPMYPSRQYEGDDRDSYGRRDEGRDMERRFGGGGGGRDGGGWSTSRYGYREEEEKNRWSERRGEGRFGGDWGGSRRGSGSWGGGRGKYA